MGDGRKHDGEPIVVLHQPFPFYLYDLPPLPKFFSSYQTKGEKKLVYSTFRYVDVRPYCEVFVPGWQIDVRLLIVFLLLSYSFRFFFFLCGGVCRI